MPCGEVPKKAENHFGISTRNVWNSSCRIMLCVKRFVHPSTCYFQSWTFYDKQITIACSVDHKCWSLDPHGHNFSSNYWMWTRGFRLYEKWASRKSAGKLELKLWSISSNSGLPITSWILKFINREADLTNENVALYLLRRLLYPISQVKYREIFRHKRSSASFLLLFSFFRSKVRLQPRAGRGGGEHFRSNYWAKVRKREQNTEGRGVGGKKLHPSPSFLWFALVPAFLTNSRGRLCCVELWYPLGRIRLEPRSPLRFYIRVPPGY